MVHTLIRQAKKLSPLRLVSPSIFHSKGLNAAFCEEKDKFLVYNNNNSELYLHDYNNTALQKRRKHDNYSNLIIRVQFQLRYIYIMTFIQYSNKGQINLSLISKHDEMNMINRRLT